MREEQQEQKALRCAQHIIKTSRVHADEYRDSWLGGESHLAKDYMRLRNEVKSLREALAAACVQGTPMGEAHTTRGRVLLDEWRVLTKDGEDPKRTWWLTHEWAVEDAASADKEYPADAPHRVVRVALVEEPAALEVPRD